MARDFFINGESMVSVKSRSDSSIPTLTQLGLAESPIVVSEDYEQRAMIVDAWGMASPDVQQMLGGATISMTLIHFDGAVLKACQELS